MATSMKASPENSPNLVRDRIRYRAGRALGECGSTGRLIARTLGAHESDISRRKNGAPGHGMGPEAQFYEGLVKLMKNDKTSPYPLIADAVALVVEEGLKDVPTENLIRRVWTLLRYEAEREGESNARTKTLAQHGDFLSIASAMQAEAVVELELAATIRVLKARGVDPRPGGGR